jgi:hypothetical protein
MSGWFYIITGGILIVVGGVLAGYGWHILPKPANLGNAPASVFENRESRIPLVDLELVRVKAAPEFAQFQVQFAYDIFLHNKSNVTMSNIRILRVIVPDKNKQKIAIHQQPQSKLSPLQKQINVLGPGESKKIHREHSPSYEYMILTVTYQDDSDKPYRCIFEGDRDGLHLKIKSPITIEKSKK